MHKQRRFIKQVSLTMALASGVTVFAPEGVRAQDVPDVTQRVPDKDVLREVSQAQGISLENLHIGSRATHRYPLTGVQLEVVKVHDKARGEAYLVAVDAQGNPADPAAMAAAEEKAKVATFGKIDPSLHATLPGKHKDEKIPVAIWLNIPDFQFDRPNDPDNFDFQALNAQLNAVAQHYAPGRQDVLDTLARMRVQAHVPKYGPFVLAALTPVQIQTMARRDDVNVVYGVEENRLFNDDGVTTERAHRVWQQGNLGSGAAVNGSTRPVVHEPDGISDFNPNLNNATHPVISWCADVDLAGVCPSGKNIGDHASEVAGVIASTDPLFRGVAPSAQLLLSANFQTFNPAAGFQTKMVDSFEWARANGGTPINMSWGSVCGGGQQTFDSRYVDWATKFLAATVVISAGNMSGCFNPNDPNADLYVSSPGLAWGVITVGSQRDNGNGFWSGDAMSGFSRFVNPVGGYGFGGQNKPEVVAVGEDRRTTNMGGITPAPGVDGTSFSSPAVAGQVTQLLARKPGQSSWPETNKAAVLASAYHNIVAGTDQDGVGAVVMNNSDDTYRLNRFLNASASCVDFDSCGGTFNKLHDNLINIPASAVGKPVRVAVSWDSDSNGSGSNVLGADIDMCIRNPANAIIACSSSFNNTWEMVEFTPTVAGLYDVQLNLFDCPTYPGATKAERCSAGASSPSWPGTFYGVAWSFRELPNFCTPAIIKNTNVSFTESVNTVNGSTFFDTYPGWGFDQAGREGVIKLTTTAVKDIKVTDSNANSDIHVVQIPNCDADPITMGVNATLLDSAAGTSADFILLDNAPAGTYYIVIDGRNGTVGSTTVSVSLTGP